MAISAILAGLLASQGGSIAESAVKGIGTVLDGMNALINPSADVPPLMGMASADFMKAGLAAIMANTNTNLQYAKKQAVAHNLARELQDDIAMAECARSVTCARFGAKARAMEAARAMVEQRAQSRPTPAQVQRFYASCKKMLAAQNTQNAMMKLCKEYEETQARGGKRTPSVAAINLSAILRGVIKGAETVFVCADIAKDVFEIAKPFLELI